MYYQHTCLHYCTEKFKLELSLKTREALDVNY